MDNKDLALKIAEHAFNDKKDLAGRPYIEHLRRVASNAPNGLFIEAILHDLLEDCPEWNEDVLRALFPRDTVDIIVVLTKGKDEEYFDYIHRVSENHYATQIKRIDLKDNLDVTRLEALEQKHFERLQKYHKALKKLES